MRLAKPYAGDNYGWHAPLLDGTEVSVAFDSGDPDRPYIAHAHSPPCMPRASSISGIWCGRNLKR
ncbi:phage baseplate assembly protein V [Cronobacter turicensis]